MTSPYAITDEMVDDIVTTAFEGGINYWCGGAEAREWPQGTSRYDEEEGLFLSEVLTHGGTLLICEHGDEPQNPRWHELTLNEMKKGIRLAADQWRQPPAVFHENHDAEGADVAVQLALWGEVRYA